MILPVGFRIRWLVVQLAISVCVAVVAAVAASETASGSTAQSFGPVAWGVLAALSHSLLGTFLLGPDPQKRRNRDRGIRGGLIVLALRFATGVGLLVAGLFVFPDARHLCVASWAGSFLLLLIAESVVFVKGVNRL